ncbi:hypothetical protein M758_5G055300 [Ceratodon purpureus]|nr:hypothetical protein M758_5G055300 [Ceratodon purpureus]
MDNKLILCLKISLFLMSMMPADFTPPSVLPCPSNDVIYLRQRTSNSLLSQVRGLFD